MSNEERLLKTLDSIDSTIKRIEQLLEEEKNNSFQKDSAEYITKAVQTATRDIFQ